MIAAAPRSPRSRPRSGGRWILAAALVIAAAPSGASAQVSERGTISFDEVRTGMRGYGKTVFSGSRIETFDVEVLGKLSNFAPRRNVILARLSGGRLAETGVLQGMSGSPVYLDDGRLAGAVAYSWSFSTEAICGITPIGEMLDLLSRERSEGRRSSRRPARALPGEPGLLARPAEIPAFLRDRFIEAAGASAGAGLSPIPLPLGFPAARGGTAGSELQRWTEVLTSLGFVPVTAGSAGESQGEAPPPLEPGAAMAVQLVRGDVEMSAVGTVTWVRGDDFLAMGHNFLALGPTALPDTRAEVFGVLPSVAASAKLAAATGSLGVVTQDRFGGIAGVTGGAAPMVPVKVSLASDPDRLTSFGFEIVDDPLLTPILMYVSFMQVFATAEKAAGDLTLTIRKGSRIRMEDGLDVNLENLYSGEQSELIASATVAYMTYLLMNNPDRESRVEGVELDLGYTDSLSLARIERIWCDRYKVAPGETLPLYVSVKPHRGEPFIESIPLVVPEEAPEGKTLLQVGDAITLSRMEYEAGGLSIQPRNLEQLVFLLNRIRTNNRIYATLIRPDNGIFISGERLPNLPPSMSTVLLDPQREEAGAARARFRGILEAERETSYALRGYEKAILEIKR